MRFETKDKIEPQHVHEKQIKIMKIVIFVPSCVFLGMLKFMCLIIFFPGWKI